MTFGLPVDSLPITHDGELKTANHLIWIQNRILLEGLPGRRQMLIELPGRYDVLIGRGKPYRNHTGNLYLHQLIDMRRNEYESASRGQKKAIAESIVTTIQSHSGRFLGKDTSGLWVPVSLDVAREKVAHVFRTTRHRQSYSAESTATSFVAEEGRKRVKVVTNAPTSNHFFSSCFN